MPLRLSGSAWHTGSSSLGGLEALNICCGRFLPSPSEGFLDLLCLETNPELLLFVRSNGKRGRQEASRFERAILSHGMVCVVNDNVHSAIFSYNNHNQESQRWTISASSLICSNFIITVGDYHDYPDYS